MHESTRPYFRAIARSIAAADTEDKFRQIATMMDDRAGAWRALPVADREELTRLYAARLGMMMRAI